MLLYVKSEKSCGVPFQLKRSIICIIQETGTLSIGRYSGELKEGQIFSGGKSLSVAKAKQNNSFALFLLIHVY